MRGEVLGRIENLLEKQLEQRQQEKDPHQLRDVLPWLHWVEDGYYSGAFSRDLWPFWREEIDLFEKSGAREWVITGSLGGGKSTAALAYTSYCIYRHTCYRYPNRLYGLGDISPLVYGYLSTTAATAMSTGFRDLVKYIDSAPYFKEKSPRKPLKTSIEFTQSNLVALPGTGRGGGGSVISRNLFLGLLDEANFYKKASSSTTGDIHVTQETYRALMNRSRTRFATDREGSLDDSRCILVSSVDHDKSFTEQRIQEAREYGESQHVTMVNPWIVQPNKFSKERFVLFKGTEAKSPEIVTSVSQAVFEFEGDNEALEKAVEIQKRKSDISVPDFIKELPFEMMLQFIEIPVTFLPEFRRDPVSAMKDIGGKPVKATDKLFSNGPAWTASVYAAAEQKLVHPFAQINPCVSERNGVSLRDMFISERMFNEDGQLRRHPNAPRFIHVDSSLSECPTGISMTHQSGSILDEITGLQVPTVEFDFNLELVAPDDPGDEVSLLEIMKFILWLHKEKRVTLGKVTYDMYASPMQLQVFRDYNIPAERLSIDLNYGAVKEFTRAFVSRTVVLYDYQPLKKCLFGVIDDRAKQKILRPPGVFKDVLDSAVGAYHNCVSKAESHFAGTPEEQIAKGFLRRSYVTDVKHRKMAEDMIGWTLTGYDRGVSDKMKHDLSKGVEIMDVHGKKPN